MRDLTPLLLSQVLRHDVLTAKVLYMPDMGLTKLKGANMKDTILPEACLVVLARNGITNDEVVENLWALCPAAWWMDLGGNFISSFNPHSIPSALGKLDLSGCKITAEELAKLSSLHVLDFRVTLDDSNYPIVAQNSQLETGGSKQFRTFVLSCLPNIWVLNCDFVSMAERLPVLRNMSDEPPTGGAWSTRIPNQRERIFQLAVQSMPSNLSISDLYRLEIAMEDYLEHAKIFNVCGVGSQGIDPVNKLPSVDLTSLLHMPHRVRLDLSVMLTTSVLLPLPNFVHDALTGLLSAHMPLADISNLIQLPQFVRTGIVSIIRRICRRELDEYKEFQHFLPKIRPGRRGPVADHTDLCTFLGSSGFNHLRLIKEYLDAPLERGIMDEEEKNNDNCVYSDLEMEILNNLPDVPTRGSCPPLGSTSFRDWVSFAARHTVLLMTRSPVCPSLTRPQHNHQHQRAYLEMLPLLTAASMTYKDLELEHTGPAKDGRTALRYSEKRKKSESSSTAGGGGGGGSSVGGASKGIFAGGNVLQYGVGLSGGQVYDLAWNTMAVSRPYETPWNDSASSTLGSVKADAEPEGDNISVGTNTETVDSVGGNNLKAQLSSIHASKTMSLSIRSGTLHNQQVVANKSCLDVDCNSSFMELSGKSPPATPSHCRSPLVNTRNEISLLNRCPISMGVDLEGDSFQMRNSMSPGGSLTICSPIDVASRGYLLGHSRSKLVQRAQQVKQTSSVCGFCDDSCWDSNFVLAPPDLIAEANRATGQAAAWSHLNEPPAYVLSQRLVPCGSSESHCWVEAEIQYEDEDQYDEDENERDDEDINKFNDEECDQVVEGARLDEGAATQAVTDATTDITIHAFTATDTAIASESSAISMTADTFTCADQTVTASQHSILDFEKFVPRQYSALEPRPPAGEEQISSAECQDASSTGLIIASGKVSQFDNEVRARSAIALSTAADTIAYVDNDNNQREHAANIRNLLAEMGTLRNLRNMNETNKNLFSSHAAVQISVPAEATPLAEPPKTFVWSSFVKNNNNDIQYKQCQQAPSEDNTFLTGVLNNDSMDDTALRQDAPDKATAEGLAAEPALTRVLMSTTQIMRMTTKYDKLYSINPAVERGELSSLGISLATANWYPCHKKVMYKLEPPVIMGASALKKPQRVNPDTAHNTDIPVIASISQSHCSTQIISRLPSVVSLHSATSTNNNSQDCDSANIAVSVSQPPYTKSCAAVDEECLSITASCDSLVVSHNGSLGVSASEPYIRPISSSSIVNTIAAGCSSNVGGSNIQPIYKNSVILQLDGSTSGLVSQSSSLMAPCTSSPIIRQRGADRAAGRKSKWSGSCSYKAASCRLPLNANFKLTKQHPPNMQNTTYADRLGFKSDMPIQLPPVIGVCKQQNSTANQDNPAPHVKTISHQHSGSWLQHLDNDDNNRNKEVVFDSRPRGSREATESPFDLPPAAQFCGKLSRQPSFLREGDQSWRARVKKDGSRPISSLSNNNSIACSTPPGNSISQFYLSSVIAEFDDSATLKMGSNSPSPMAAVGKQGSSKKPTVPALRRNSSNSKAVLVETDYQQLDSTRHDIPTAFHLRIDPDLDDDTHDLPSSSKFVSLTVSSDEFDRQNFHF